MALSLASVPSVDLGGAAEQDQGCRRPLTVSLPRGLCCFWVAVAIAPVGFSEGTVTIETTGSMAQRPNPAGPSVRPHCDGPLWSTLGDLWSLVGLSLCLVDASLGLCAHRGSAGGRPVPSP